MKEYRFILNEEDAWEIVNALMEKVGRQGKDMIDDVGNLSTLNLHIERMLKTSTTLNKVTEVMAYDTDETVTDEAVIEFGTPTRKGLYLVYALTRSNKGRPCPWFIFRWDGEKWTNKAGKEISSDAIVKFSLLEEDA